METPQAPSLKWLLFRALLTLVVAVSGSVADSPVAASPDEMHAAVAEVKEGPTLPRIGVRKGRRNGTKSIAAPVAPKPKSILPVLSHSDILPLHQRIANDVLSLFPYACRLALKNFYVRYDSSMDRRGFAGKSTMIIDGRVPIKEYAQLIAHEMGHVADLGCLVGNPKSGESGFTDGDEVIYRDDPSIGFYTISWMSSSDRKPGMDKEAFLSEYARSDPFEDFSEGITYALFHIDAFEARAKENPVIAQKLAWIRKHVIPKGAYISRGTRWDGEVPWDVTKLDFDAPTLLAQY